MPPTPATRYRCGFPGCTKKYASTDGVRKHARKTHTAWLKSVDEASLTRDRETESKPSTYCIAEMDDQPMPLELQTASAIPMMSCRDMYDDAMPAHLRQASFAAATAISMSLHSGSSLLHARMAPPHHAALLSRAMPCAEATRRMSPSEFAQDAMLPRMTACPTDCGCTNPWSAEPLPPHPDMAKGQKEAWSNEFNALLARAETTQQKRPSPVFELDDPLCLTPPMAPLASGGSSACLSPFELEEKRPSKLARVSEVPLKPEPLHTMPVDMLSEAHEGLVAAAPPPTMSFSSDVSECKLDSFDFFEALLAM